MSKYRIFVKPLFILHTLYAIVFPLLFFIPSTVWSWRIEFHALLTGSTFLLLYLWGLQWTIAIGDKLYAICIFDTLMQRARGFPFSDARNFRHTFLKEFAGLLRIPWLTEKVLLYSLLVCIIVAQLLYVLKRYGIILW